MFTPIPVEVICYEPEIVGINLCQKTVGTKEITVEPMQDLAQVAEATNKLRGLSLTLTLFCIGNHFPSANV